MQLKMSLRTAAAGVLVVCGMALTGCESQQIDMSSIPILPTPAPVTPPAPPSSVIMRQSEVIRISMPEIDPQYQGLLSY